MPNLTRRAVAAATTVALLSCTGAERPGDVNYSSESEALTVCSGGATLQGVDVSSYQGNIDWGSVAGAGIRFAYAKATESNDWKDPTFPGNWAGIKAHGMYRGAYHFFHPNVDGKAQADYFLAYAEQGSGNIPPMLDWEVTDGVGGATAAANAKAFIDEVSAKTGRPTIVYTSPGLWDGFGVPESFAAETLWVADYLYCDTGGCCPLMPNGWSHWAMWQWESTGNIPGISGHVDRDVFNGDEAALAALAGASTNPGGGGGGTTGPGSGGTHPGGGGVSSGGGAEKVCGNSAIGHGVGKGTKFVCTANDGHGKPATEPKPSCGAIKPGHSLERGEGVTSCDGRFSLTMQGDGNLVLYSNGIALWATGTNAQGGYEAIMQDDGNFVLYNEEGCAVWATNTGGKTGSWLALQDDGNLVIYDKTKALWSSGTGPIGLKPKICGMMSSGDGLAPGESIEACGGCFNLVNQGDGNLVLYTNKGRAIWATGTNGKGGYAFNMQGDGNAVLYSKEGCALFDTNTEKHDGSILAVQDDGNVVVYSNHGTAIWASNTVKCHGACMCH